MIFPAIIFLWVVLLAVAIRFRSVPAAIFIVCAVAHQVLCGSIDGPKYYVTAAIFDSLAVVLLWGCVAKDRRNKIARRLQIISIISMILNFVGLLMYEGGFWMQPYNAAFLVLYSSAIAVVMGGGPGVEGLGTGSFKFRPGLRRSTDCLSEKQI